MGMDVAGQMASSYEENRWQLHHVHSLYSRLGEADHRSISYAYLRLRALFLRQWAFEALSLLVRGVGSLEPIYAWFIDLGEL
jgi:hypothetical protein